MDATWPHIAGLVTSAETAKNVLLAAIEAPVSIHPSKAPEVLSDLLNAEDEDIAAAIHEALAHGRR